ncbi:MAG: siderophore-interacting protein, partial [Propionibacteriaceae bacterium]|nr:siderophore-interacting protein [Propionibacteriaceae bacterium]
MSAVENAATFTLTRRPLELRRRRVRVRSVHQVTPSYRRVVLEGTDLAGFNSLAADDHLRIFFPPSGEPLPQPTDDGMPAGLESREYTPFAWDGANWLAIDFVLHGDGVASRWAETVQPG